MDITVIKCSQADAQELKQFFDKNIEKQQYYLCQINDVDRQFKHLVLCTPDSMKYGIDWIMVCAFRSLIKNTVEYEVKAKYTEERGANIEVKVVHKGNNRLSL